MQKDLSRFILEGSLNTVFGTVIGGAFLVAFALALGATDAHIGLLTAMPALLNLVQIIGSYLISLVGSAKRVCLVASGIFRLIWLCILLMPMFILSDPGTGAVVLIAFIAAASLFSSLSGIAWMSWITPTVPESIRGRFFGHRNMVGSFVGMVIGLIAGRFIDFWQNTYPEGSQMILGYSLLFAFGIIFGVAGWVVLTRISDPHSSKSTAQTNFSQQVQQPLRDAGFRKWIVFAAVWGFSVGIAGPFFSVYMIRTLQISFSLIATFGLVSGLFNTMGMRFWGGVIDDIGSKPLLYACSVVAGLTPLLWLAAAPGSYSILWVINILTGLAWSGIGLSTSQMLMSAAPKEGSSIYFSVFAAVTGLSGAIAPIVGGALVGMLNPVQIGPLYLIPVQIVFVLTAILRLASLSLLKPVPAAKDMPVSEAMAKLRQASHLQLLRGTQQVGTLGLQFENALVHVTAGTSQMEGRMARLIDRGAALAQKVEGRSAAVEQGIKRQLDRWERLLDTIVAPIARIVAKVIDMLKDDDDEPK